MSVENKNLEFYFEKYKNYLSLEKGRSRGTIKEYLRKIRIFLNWLKQNNIKKINDDVIYNFRIFLNNKNLSLKTQSYYLIALRSFFKFLKKRNIKTYDPFKI